MNIGAKLYGLQWRFYSLLAPVVVGGGSVNVGRGVKCDRFPIVSGAAYGQISIGDRCTLTSCSQGTALGVRSPVILRLLSRGASIRIGADTGMSGTVICAAKSVLIGCGCLIGADVMIFDTDFHNPEPTTRRYAKPDWDRISDPIQIGNNVFIGTRAIITKGAKIGEGSIIGAGSVVTGEVPENMIFAGVPARAVGRVSG